MKDITEPSMEALAFLL